MQWVRLDSQAFSHPKLLRAGAEACALWAAGLCHCNTHATNGRIDLDMIPLLFPPLGPLKAGRLAKRLCEVGLWHDRGDHYEVHDYEDFQAEATKETVTARREYERSRKREQRSRGRRPADVRDNVRDNVPRDERDMSGTSVPDCPDLSPRAGTRAGVPASDRPTDRPIRQTEAVVVPISDRGSTRAAAAAPSGPSSQNLTAAQVAAVWNRVGAPVWAVSRAGALYQPLTHHEKHFEALAVGLNALPDPRGSLETLVAYFWLAPHGPVGSGRIANPKPEVLVEGFTRDLAEALAWKAGEPPPAPSVNGHRVARASSMPPSDRAELQPFPPMPTIPREVPK